jgi:hypothetical protein
MIYPIEHRYVRTGTDVSIFLRGAKKTTKLDIAEQIPWGYEVIFHADGLIF